MAWWGDEFVGRKSRRVWEGGGRRLRGEVRGWLGVGCY